ncbi:MAG: MarR family transcriptional regulator [Acetobacteraceae bacterium]|nr:MarR family transcriptional regulator [Acetobacteraceae bacterium]
MSKTSRAAPFPMEQSIGSQVRRTHRLFAQALQAALAPQEIPLGMWYFLRALWEEDGLTQREISERVGATAPTAVEQLRNMEKRGLLSRRASEEDRRKVHFHLTELGRSVETELLAYAEGVNRIAMEGFTEGEIGFLRLALMRMQDNLAKAKG